MAMVPKMNLAIAKELDATPPARSETGPIMKVTLLATEIQGLTNEIRTPEKQLCPQEGKPIPRTVAGG